MATAIAVCPRDLNLVLVGYEGGVIVWNIQNSATERTYEFIIPPGAPGGGTYMDSVSQTRRFFLPLSLDLLTSDRFLSLGSLHRAIPKCYLRLLET